MSSFPTRLPVEVLDDIIHLAIALGMMSIKDATLICARWKQRYQQTLFKSFTLDPSSADIPDLEKHAHLAPCIEVLRVAHRSRSSTSPNNYELDITETFTKFLIHATKVKFLVLLDTRIQWGCASPNTINAFRTVFERPSFRSLEVSVRTSLPSWMLLHGTSVASHLAVNGIGPIVAPRESVELVSYQCSLTSLALYGNSSVEQMALFFLQHRKLAIDLLRNVVDVNLDYTEVYDPIGSTIIPYVEILVGFLAPQLEDLRLCIKFSTAPPSYISASAISKLTALQRLSIHLVGRSTASTDTILSAEMYTSFVFSGLPSPCLVKLFSLRVDDRRESDSESYASSYQQLLSGICYRQLTRRQDWPFLGLSHVLVNIASRSFTEPSSIDGRETVPGLRITWLLQLNTAQADDFTNLVTPQIV